MAYSIWYKKLVIQNERKDNNTSVIRTRLHFLIGGKNRIFKEK